MGWVAFKEEAEVAYNMGARSAAGIVIFPERAKPFA
jgi:hypothetical protein